MKKVVVIVNTYKKEAVTLSKKVCAFLTERGVQCDCVDFCRSNETPDFSPYEAAITVGGDGTVLFAARACLKNNVPIFPINLGEFGFIAGIQKELWQGALDAFLQNNVPLTPRSMLTVTAFRGNASGTGADADAASPGGAAGGGLGAASPGGAADSVTGDEADAVHGTVTAPAAGTNPAPDKPMPIFSCDALNDVVISADKAARIVSLDVSYNGYPFGLFKADGIIVATATGSTAYSAAAGGPIVDPTLDVFVLSPICPFSLSNRPLVLPLSGALTVQVLPSRGATISVTCDGQVSFSLMTNDTVLIQQSSQKVLLADCSESTFYQALRSKLHWSGGPVA